MKTRLNALVKYFSILSKRLARHNDWTRALRSTRSMMGYLNRIPIIFLGRSGRTWILGSLCFARFVLKVKRHQGLKGLAIVLKVSNTCVLKAIAGQPLRGVAGSLGHRVALTRTGLPCWLPKVVRRAILRGDRTTIRVWLTFMSSYRVLDYLGKPKLSTITQEGLVFNTIPYINFIPIFFKKFSILGIKGWEVPKWKPRLITKSGPGTIPADAKNKPSWALTNNTVALIVQARFFADASNKGLLDRFMKLASLIDQESLYSKLREVITNTEGIKTFLTWMPSHLGKLGVKEEPGKVRVFAMVDWWTQTLLQPVHKLLFGILKQIPQDATFDQEAAVQRGIELLAKSQYAASYDLSAATDRLPVLLQSFLVSYLLPNSGQLWAELLVKRTYALPKGIRKLGMKLPEAVTYAVGQPMGALSSWAMLALTHHFIVQFAAHKVGKFGWFSRYLVLGDDIVIFDRAVASSYLAVMKDLGVGINLVKSVESTTSFEFAKRFIHLGVNLSPISFKELDMAGASLEGATLLLSKFSEREWKPSQLARFRGYGYKSLSMIQSPLRRLPRALRLLLVYISMPGISPVSFVKFLDWFGMTALRQSYPVNAHSAWSVVMSWWSKTTPIGWTARSGSLVPRDIWGDVGLSKIKHWRIEYLESTLQSLFWPAQLDYLEAHKAHDKIREEVEAILPEVGEVDRLEEFINAFLAWDSENSLTPVKVSITEYRSRDVVKQRVGRWLRWWSQAATTREH